MTKLLSIAPWCYVETTWLTEEPLPMVEHIIRITPTKNGGADVECVIRWFGGQYGRPMYFQEYA